MDQNAVARHTPILLIIGFFLLVACALPARADSLPDPLFFDSVGDFYEKVDDGQLERLLELHLFQYGSDPEWGEAWAASRFDRTATLLTEHGSISSKELYARLDFAMNFTAHDRVTIRYEHTQWEDGRFELGANRFDGLYWPGWRSEKLALVVSGWPTHEKSYVNFGLGVYLGRPDDDYGLYLLIRDDRWIHEDKAQDELRFTAQPIRYIAEGQYGNGPWFLHGSINLGEPWRAEEIDPDAGVDRFAAGHLRYGDVAGSWEGAPWRLGLRAKFVDEETRQRDGTTGEAFALERLYWRLDGYATRQWESWRATTSLAIAAQKDDFSEEGELNGDYEMTSWIFGLEGGYLGWAPFEVRLGYLGSVGDMEREVEPLTPTPALGDRSESGYNDKLQLRGLYSFGETFHIEAAVSKEVVEGDFGGGTIKAFGRF